MTDRKTNKEAVKDYHAKLQVITIRIPQTDIDYKALVQKHAESVGLSMNEYILTLIEKDMHINIPKGVKATR